MPKAIIVIRGGRDTPMVTCITALVSYGYDPAKCKKNPAGLKDTGNRHTHTHTHTHTHPFNGPLSGTTWVSRYQTGKTNLDFTKAKRQ